jgi:hypothetical protein
MMNVNPGTALPGARSFPWYETCNIGRLLQFGYLGNLNSAFDPALDSSSVFSGGTDSSQNWGANTQFYSSYIFNPHAAYIPSIDTQNASVIPATLPSSTGWPGSVPILYCPYPTVSTLPQDKCLAIDMVTNVSAMAHMSGSTVGDVNLVFGDAHAVTVPVPRQVIQFLQQISGNADLATWASKKHPPGMANAPFPNGMEWGIGPTTVTVAGATARPLPQPSGSPTPGQVYLDSYVDLLESLANGGDVVRLGANTQQGPASDQFWLWNGGAGRVTYTIPQ